MDDDTIFRRLNHFGRGGPDDYDLDAVDRRTRRQKVRDRRKYKIVSALQQFLIGRINLNRGDLWLVCLSAAEVFMCGEEDYNLAVSFDYWNGYGDGIKVAPLVFFYGHHGLHPFTTLTGNEVADFLLKEFPHYHGEESLPLSQDIEEHFGDVLATLKPSEKGYFNNTLRTVMRHSEWNLFGRSGQLDIIEDILEKAIEKRHKKM